MYRNHRNYSREIRTNASIYFLLIVTLLYSQLFIVDIPIDIRKHNNVFHYQYHNLETFRQ
jgi:hypothetical protein